MPFAGMSLNVIITKLLIFIRNFFDYKSFFLSLGMDENILKKTKQIFIFNKDSDSELSDEGISKKRSKSSCELTDLENKRKKTKFDITISNNIKNSELFPYGPYRPENLGGPKTNNEVARKIGFVAFGVFDSFRKELGIGLYDFPKERMWPDVFHKKSSPELNSPFLDCEIPYKKQSLAQLQNGYNFFKHDPSWTWPDGSIHILPDKDSQEALIELNLIKQELAERKRILNDNTQDLHILEKRKEIINLENNWKRLLETYKKNNRD